MCINIKIMKSFFALSLGMVVGLYSTGTMASGYGGPYNFGSTASASDIAKLDIDVEPDGSGMPPGSGNYTQGKEVYTAKCAACHGADLVSVPGTGADTLIGGRGSLASGKPLKTVESYWPYASTVFDYVKRAMPFNAPGSLSDDEIYSVVAYVLAEANIFDRSATLDASSLAKIEMPNKDGFIADSRPDVFNFE
jgi:S-disulfanyl-L-cysteine oxidoreductase SoxD